jgi:hypothetical protein
MSETEALAVAAPVPGQPPYLKLAAASRSEAVQDVAEMAGMRIAMGILQSGGNLLPGEPTEPALDTGQITARMNLALKVLQQKINRRRLALALLQAPDIAFAVVSDESNPAGAMESVDIGAAWLRNWTDFAMVVALDDPN